MSRPNLIPDPIAIARVFNDMQLDQGSGSSEDGKPLRGVTLDLILASLSL